MKDSIILISVFVLFSFAWFKIYVQPNDARAQAIVECMDGDGSFEAYEACVYKTKSRAI
jgi:hypothetical protein